MTIALHYSLAAGIAFLVMACAFVLALRLRFFSLVDVAWTFSFGLIAVSFGAMAASFDQRWVFYGMVVLWSLRLGTYIAARLVAHYPNEDTRYIELKQKWAESLTSRFALFFLVQALSVVALSTPLVLVASDPEPGTHVLGRLAVLLWFVGVIGEAIADAQLRAFKMDPKNAGQVCEVGFWSLCRHPNYFFEWIIWCSFGLYGLSAPLGVLSLIAPLCMFYLLNYVSGVPPAEAQSIKSKGEKYIDYQRRVNKFFPWVSRRK